MSDFTESALLRTVLLRPPSAVAETQNEIDTQWRKLNYLGCPDIREINREHAAFADAIEASGARIEYAISPPGLTLDAVYIRDAALMTPAGAILSRMGKADRQGEPDSLNAEFNRLGVKIVGEITLPAKLEGGDSVWIDPKTLFIGRTWRTNQAAIDQVRNLLGSGFDVIAFDMPNHKGPGDVFHLMSVLSPVSQTHVVGYPPLMPVPMIEALNERGMAVIPVPDEEFDTMGCNVLALGDDKVILVADNPVTRDRLAACGLAVKEISGKHLCWPGQGGPTCLTLPLSRGRD